VKKRIFVKYEIFYYVFLVTKKESVSLKLQWLFKMELQQIYVIGVTTSHFTLKTVFFRIPSPSTPDTMKEAIS